MSSQSPMDALPAGAHEEHSTIASHEPPEPKATSGILPRAGIEPPGLPIEPTPREGLLPVSFAQERLWFVAQMFPQAPTYNEPIMVQMAEPVDGLVLAQSLTEIIRRHEAWRTVFTTAAGVPMQRILPPRPFDLPIADLTSLPAAEREPEALRLAVNDARRPFDLRQGPLVRALLIRLSPTDTQLVVTAHHIVVDGISFFQVFLPELHTLYTAFLNGQPSPLAPVPVQYADFAAWQRGWLTEEELAPKLAYWRTHMAGLTELALPIDHPRPNQPTWDGARIPVALSSELTAKLRDLGHRAGVTLFTTLLAAWKTLLFRTTGQKDIVVGSASAGRPRPELEPLIGFFNHNLVLRTQLDGSLRFLDLLPRVAEVLKAAREHEDVPFDRLVTEFAADRSVNKNPIYQNVFLLMPRLPPLDTPPRWNASRFDIGTAKVDVYLELHQRPQGLVGHIEYQTELFSEATIKRMAGHLVTLLEGIVRNPEQRLSELPILTAAEEEQLRVWQGPAVAPLPDSEVLSLEQLFEAQAARTPSAIAVEHGSRRVTYAELNARANQLAHYLHAQGVGPEVLVGLCVERSVEAMVGILGVLKAGGAYVPLDPTYPIDRLRFMVEDADIKLLLSTRGNESAVQYHGRTIFVDTDWPEIAQHRRDNPAPIATAEHLAYVIYTSGSTGRPKGVLVERRGLYYLAKAQEQMFGLGVGSRILQFFSLNFDGSVWDFTMAWPVGATLVLADSEAMLPGPNLTKLLKDQDIHVLMVTPSALAVTPYKDLPALHTLISTGEALAAELLDRWAPGRRFFNLGAPTETTVVSIAGECRAGEGKPPWGRPFEHVPIYVLDSAMQVLPVGVPGELYIGGPGVTRGYLNRPDQTAARFIPNHFAGEGGARLYRTGDRVKWLPEGNIDYLGRMDRQIKLRGFRIELDEIEAVLQQHLSVQQTRVVTRQAVSDDTRVVAYIVPDAQRAPAVRKLLELERRGLLGDRPRYELPNGMTIIHLNKGETDFLYREIFEDEAYARHGIMLRDDSCIFDVGANIGLFAIYVQKRCPRSVIYAFEPIPPVFEVLQLNVDLHGLNAKLFACGLGSEAKLSPFTYYPHNSVISGQFADAAADRETVKTYLRNHYAEAALSEQELDRMLSEWMSMQHFICPLKTISDVIREQGIERIDLLKIDVEKSEIDVLSGVQPEDWRRIEQVVLEVHDIDGRLAHVTELLSGHGYEVSTEQNRMLAHTGLYDVYARRPDGRLLAAAAAPAQQAEQCWESPERLLNDIRSFAKTKLPEYMLPSAFVLLDELPLLPSGKVNLKALPALRSPVPSAAPASTRMEQIVAEIWRPILGIDGIDVDAPFFELGGHSLALARVQTKLTERLGVDLDIMTLLKLPTIRQLAAHLAIFPVLQSASARADSIDGSEARGSSHLRLEAAERISLSAVRTGITPQWNIASEQQGDRDSQSIAIIGMSGRLPGARDIEAFWHNLCAGVDSIMFFSRRELLLAGIGVDRVDNPSYVPASGYLQDIELFDAAFFGYNAREAEITDPQHRLLLECTYTALEDAGYDPRRFPGAIGVFMGAASEQYLHRHVYAHPDIRATFGDYYLNITNSRDFLATRLAYKLDLRGPGMTIQTACSTSLVTVILACQSLLQRQCDIAVAGGVSLDLAGRYGYLYREGTVFSSDGHCRAFDARASGIVGGDGVGVVVLKRLRDALADRDNIYAVIRGTALANDGALKLGYAAPSAEGQARAIAEAMASARFDPASVTYVETHGTGTPLGDPIEIEALTEVFGRSTTRTAFCALGAVKTNIGHLNAAAGIAGLIKAILCLQHRKLPPMLHYEKPNPNIDLASSPFYINTTLVDWNPPGSRRACVSSFGLGGTNAHVVLEEAPGAHRLPFRRMQHLLILSARTRAALDAASANLAAHLQRHPEHDLADVAYTLQVGRRAFAHRRVMVCHDAAEAARALAANDPRRIVTAGPTPERRPVVFLFPGHGNQFIHMGLDAYEHEWAFRSWVDRCADVLHPHLGLDIRQLLYPGKGDAEYAAEQLRQVAVGLPVLFTIEYALAMLFMEWGIRPQAMIGHSVGEYAAACMAGVFDWPDALWLVAQRGRLMQQVPAGAMLAVPISEAQACDLCGDSLGVAAVNGPALSVIAGPTPAIEALEQQLSCDGIHGSRLHISHAAHSQAMDPILADFERCVALVKRQAPRIPFLSNVTGKWIEPAQATSTGYWVRHLRDTVRFSAGLELLFQEPDRVLLEVGPGETLAHMITRHPQRPAAQPVYSSLPRRRDDESAAATLLATLGNLWLTGVDVDWNGYHTHEPRHRISLPTYPFERQRYWLDSPPSAPPAEVSPSTMPPEEESGDVSRWLYRPVWRVAPWTAQSTRSRVPRQWLVFADGGEIAVRAVSMLRARGDHVTIVRPGGNFNELPIEEFTVQPASADHYQLLVQRLVASGRRPRHVLYLWNLGSSGPKTPSLDHLAEQLLGFYGLLFLAQALEHQGIQTPVHIAIATSGIWSIAGEPVTRPQDATVLGPCLVIPQEYDFISCRAIDLDDGGTDTPELDPVPLLLAELDAPQREAIIAYRGGRRFYRTFENMPPQADHRPIPLRRSGVYLITGGLGGIGLSLAKYLARTMHASLILTTRDAFPARCDWSLPLTAAEHVDPASRRRAEQICDLKEIESLGGQVLVVRADVTSRAQMSECIREARSRFGDLNGVIHAAGLAGGGVIQRKTFAEAESILAPKVCGTLVLQEVLGELTLDFFVLCSSLASIMGVFGQAEYCAANAFQDAFAHYLQPHSKAIVMAINWDGWKEVGIAARAEAAAREQERAQAQPVRTVSGHPVFTGASEYPDRTELEMYLSPTEHWVIGEHLVMGKPTLVGTAYLDLVLTAFKPPASAAGVALSNVTFLRPLTMNSNARCWLRVSLQPRGHSSDFVVRARSGSGDTEWQEHACGTVACLEQRQTAPLPLSEIIDRCAEDVVQPDMPSGPISLGARWHCLRHCWFGDAEALAELELAAQFLQELDSFRLHPALLDAATGFMTAKLPKLYMPFGYQRVRVYGRLPARVYSYVKTIRSPGSDSDSLTFDVIITDSSAMPVVEVNGYLLRRRLEPADLPNAVLTLTTPGQLEALAWVDEPRQLPPPGQIEVAVHTASLNFKEVLLALGMLPASGKNELRFGAECAGTITAVGDGVSGFRMGDKVLGVGQACFARFACLPAATVAPIPPGMSFEEAATIPIAFATAYYALQRVAKLRSGERVLIHAAAGGVGLAAIQIARLLGAEVFATAGSSEKREYVTSLGVQHVFDSRSVAFGREVSACTGGRGVDVVLNSLGGEFVREGLSALAPYGRFLELGVRGVYSNDVLPLRLFERGITFSLIKISSESPDFVTMWHELIEHFTERRLHPLPYKLFAPEDARHAFEFMAQARHIGRVVISFPKPIDIDSEHRSTDDVRPKAAVTTMTRLRRPGIAYEHFLSPEGGVAVFVQALASGVTQVVVSTVDLHARLNEVRSMENSARFSTAPPPRFAHVRPGLERPYLAPRDKLERQLVDAWTTFFGIEQIGVQDSFFDLGGDSLSAVQLTAHINAKLKLALSSHSLLRAPSIAELARMVDGRRGPADVASFEAQCTLPDSLVVLKRGSCERALFLAPPGGGHVYIYHDLVSFLGNDHSVYALQARGLDGRSELLGSIPEMAADYIAAIRMCQSQGPYSLGGASLGGILAYEMAQQLHALGQQIAFVAMIDSPGPGDLPPLLRSDAEIVRYLLQLGALNPELTAELHQCAPEEQVRRFIHYRGNRTQIIPSLSPEQMVHFLNVWRVESTAMVEYTPTSSQFPIVFFRATERDAVNPRLPDHAWRKLCQGKFDLHEIPGNHITINYAPNVKHIADILRTYMSA